MNHQPSLPSAAFVLAVVTLSLLWSPVAADPSATPTSCDAKAQQPAEIADLVKEIARAPTLDQARTLALEPTEAALRALGTARNLAPFSADLQKAHAHLAHSRTRIAVAESQHQVADEFSSMMVAALDDPLVKVDAGKAGCVYSTGETIAIVIGLILGIIPGLIFLVLFC